MIFSFSFLSFLTLYTTLIYSKKTKDIPCEWKSLNGLHYDLKPLTRKNGQTSYFIKDGDIPCTPEVEPTYSFVWNFCSTVTSDSMPASTVCDTSKSGAVIQYLDRSDGYKECHVIGRYDKTKDDLSYKLLDERNPTKGISMTYPLGEECPGGSFRSATIDVLCDNVDYVIDSASEPSTCEYHMIMKSYHGCPTECPITKHGLCNSHGHCAFDKVSRQAYCYCNEGYGGSSCSDKIESSSSSGESSGLQTQIILVVILLIVTMGLGGVIIYMIFRVTALRKERLLENAAEYAPLSDGGKQTELTKGGRRF